MAWAHHVSVFHCPNIKDTFLRDSSTLLIILIYWYIAIHVQITPLTDLQIKYPGIILRKSVTTYKSKCNKMLQFHITATTILRLIVYTVTRILTIVKWLLFQHKQGNIFKFCHKMDEHKSELGRVFSPVDNNLANQEWELDTWHWISAMLQQSVKKCINLCLNIQDKKCNTPIDLNKLVLILIRIVYIK